MKISKDLKKLAQLFSKHSTLYVVGGMVRNDIVGIKTEKNDIDITSALTPGEVEKVIDNNGFYVISSYKKLGTLLLCNESKTEHYEYTTFRKDSYKINSGSHMPVSISFIRNIEDDAKRRDFKMNAIYYDILKETYVDVLGGIGDLASGKISTTRKPESVFREDALRILRLVRQACELNLDIEPKTYKAAKEAVGLLRHIHSERKRDELLKILNSDNRYKERKSENSHIKGIKLLCDLGAMQYIIPEVMSLKGCYVKETAKRDLFEQTMRRLEKTQTEEVRLAALLNDIGKPVCLKSSGKIYGCDKVGAGMVHRILGAEGLKMPFKTVEKISNLIKTQDFNLNSNARINTIKRFIINNIEIMNWFYELREAELYAREMKTKEGAYQKIKDIHNEILKDGTPLNLSRLKVTGDDCLKLGLSGKNISLALDELFWESVYDKNLRTYERQYQFLERWKERAK